MRPNGVAASVWLNGLVTHHVRIANFRFTDASGQSSMNPLWAPPWPTIEPYRFREKLHGAKYGPIAEARLLSGVSPDNLCLDYFGPPVLSTRKRRRACNLTHWGSAEYCALRKGARAGVGKAGGADPDVELPEAGTPTSAGKSALAAMSRWPTFERRSGMREDRHHLFHSDAHVVLLPFLDSETCRTAISGARGRLFRGYGAAGSCWCWGKDLGPVTPRGPRVGLLAAFPSRLGFVRSVTGTRGAPSNSWWQSQEHLLMGIAPPGR